MEYGESHNRYNIYEFDHSTRILSLSVMAIRPDKEYIDTIAKYSLKTGAFECLYWGDIQSLKQVVSLFFSHVLSIFEVQSIEGPEKFMEKWGTRMVKRKEMKEMEENARRL
jgi:hypothetical protein